LYKGDAPPIFVRLLTLITNVYKNLDGISYVYMKKKGLYIVITTKTNSSPSYLIETLGRICKVYFFDLKF